MTNDTAENHTCCGMTIEFMIPAISSSAPTT